jgi:hypothetical protein
LATLNELPSPPQCADVKDLAALNAELVRLKKLAASQRAEVQSKQQQLDGFAKDLEVRLADLGACPTCRQQLDVASFLAGNHNHDAHGQDQSPS